MTFKTTRVIEFPIGLEPMFLTIYAFGICEIDCSIDWLEEFRIHMFPSSKHDYPFLRRHLSGKWWLCKPSVINKPIGFKVWNSTAAYFSDLITRLPVERNNIEPSVAQLHSYISLFNEPTDTCPNTRRYL